MVLLSMERAVLRLLGCRMMVVDIFCLELLRVVVVERTAVNAPTTTEDDDDEWRG